MKQKWKDNGGETLVEVLASILIGTLSVALLFSTILASIHIERTAGAADEVFSSSLKAAEEQTADAEHPVVDDKKVKVTVNGTGVTLSEAEVKVNFYGGEGAWSFVLPSP